MQAPFGALSMCKTVRLTACCVNAGTPAQAPSSNTTALAPTPSASNYGNSSTPSTSSTSSPPDAAVPFNIPLQSPAQLPLQLVSSPDLVFQSLALNASSFCSNSNLATSLGTSWCGCKCMETLSHAQFHDLKCPFTC